MGIVFNTYVNNNDQCQRENVSGYIASVNDHEININIENVGGNEKDGGTNSELDIEWSWKEMADNDSSEVRNVDALGMGGCERDKYEDGEPKY